MWLVHQLPNTYITLPPVSTNDYHVTSEKMVDCPQSTSVLDHAFEQQKHVNDGRWIIDWFMLRVGGVVPGERFWLPAAGAWRGNWHSSQNTSALWLRKVHELQDHTSSSCTAAALDVALPIPWFVGREIRFRSTEEKLSQFSTNRV